MASSMGTYKKLRARQVRFVLITGSNDFRRGNILDIYHGGFSREQFQAKLFDVPGMGHDTLTLRPWPLHSISSPVQGNACHRD
jgi:hypothetical protein